ncbi:MAG: tetratricopeptide repeat protein [Promethearchaeota archaeon]
MSYQKYRERAEPYGFKINRYITLKLENNETVIYINKERFIQCVYLLLNIPVNQVEDYEGIDSIDKAAEKLDDELNFNDSDVKISSKTEFWGHCSNLQAWVENNYNTCLIHRNLAFPLLRKLTEAGDPQARRVFKEEIAKRFASGYKSVVTYLLNEGFLDYLSREELEILTDSNADPEFWKKVGEQFLKNAQFDKAVVAFSRAWQLDSEENSILTRIELVYKQQKEYSVDPSLWEKLGKNFIRKRNFNKAIEAFSRALEINSKEASICRKIGLVYKKQKQYDFALKFFKYALKTNINDVKTWIYLSDIYAKKGMYNKAKNKLKYARYTAKKLKTFNKFRGSIYDIESKIEVAKWEEIERKKLSYLTEVPINRQYQLIRTKRIRRYTIEKRKEDFYNTQNYICFRPKKSDIESFEFFYEKDYSDIFEEEEDYFLEFSEEEENVYEDFEEEEEYFLQFLW